MKRHPEMAARVCPGSQGESRESLATQPSAACNQDTTVQHLELTAGTRRPPRPTARQRPRAQANAVHALLLSGQLDRSSANRLEVEIERLCESGIAEITLDLTQLAAIDLTGVAVIAFRRKWCRRHGCELVLVGVASHIRHTFEAAGATELLCDERTRAARAERTQIAARRAAGPGPSAADNATPIATIEEADAATV
jgi:anti-anti-sigma factor